MRTLFYCVCILGIVISSSILFGVQAQTPVNEMEESVVIQEASVSSRVIPFLTQLLPERHAQTLSTMLLNLFDSLDGLVTSFIEFPLWRGIASFFGNFSDNFYDFLERQSAPQELKNDPLKKES